MYMDWTKHLKDAEEKARFESYVRSAKPVLDRLRDILAEREANLYASERTQSAYVQPGWDYKQAHRNGNMEEIWFLKKLTDLDQQI